LYLLVAMALLTVTLGGWLAVAAVLALGAWLIVRRERWAQDVYQPPLGSLGRAAPVIPAALGVLLIVAAIWAVGDAL
jgi:O-antigen ligase